MTSDTAPHRGSGECSDVTTLRFLLIGCSKKMPQLYTQTYFIVFVSSLTHSYFPGLRDLPEEDFKGKALADRWDGSPLAGALP